MFALIACLMIQGQSCGSRENISKVIARLSVKIGDLVKLMQHCRDSDRLAMVVETPQELGLNCVKIVFLDNGTKTPATKNNLELVSEAR